MRAAILEVPARREELAEEARGVFGLATDRTTVMVFGGSQGALHLDETIAAALPILAGRRDLQLLVITGPDHVAVVEKVARTQMQLRVHVVPYLDRMESAYALADLAVTRAGATSIAEMTVCGVPMILVPYPYATENHQEANAGEMVRAGAADVVLDKDLSPEGLARRMLELVDDRDRRARMAAASAGWGKPDAAADLASLVVRTAR